MSNEKNEREILSAYFDGELSPDDRSRAEQILEGSVAARSEIDEIAELSELLKSFPSAQAPSELLPAIMRQAERETLLPIDGDAPASIGRTGRTTWLAVIAGIAATAAAVLITVQMFPPPASSGFNSLVADATQETGVPPRFDMTADRSSGVRYAESETNGVRAAFDKDSPELAMDSSIAGEATPADSRVRAPAGFAGKQGAFADEQSIAANGGAQAAAGQPAGVAQRPADDSAPPAIASRALAMNADALQHAEEGDVIQYFSRSESTVTTYMVTVVDVRQAVDKLQVLLARNDIPDGAAVEKEGVKREDPAAEERPKTENDNRLEEKDESKRDIRAAGKESERLFAVYVETTPERFRSVLKDVLHEELFASLQPKPPVDELQIELADAREAMRRGLFRQLEKQMESEKDQLTAQNDRVQAEFRKEEKPPAAATRAAADPKNAPAPSADSLPRKGNQSGKSKPGEGVPGEGQPGSKAAANAGRLAQSANEEEPANRDDVRYRRKKADGYADAERQAARSFQLKVQLAPLSEAKKKMRGEEIANGEQLDAKSAEPAAETPEQLPASPAAADESLKSAEVPVRILFVFRQASPVLPAEKP